MLWKPVGTGCSSPNSLASINTLTLVSSPAFLLYFLFPNPKFRSISYDFVKFSYLNVQPTKK